MEGSQQDRQPWRCVKCHNLLARLYLGPGSEVQVKCPSCNSYNAILVSRSDEELRLNHPSTTPYRAARGARMEI